MEGLEWHIKEQVESAQALEARGWSVVPIEAGSKKAAIPWKILQKARWTPEEISQHYTQNSHHNFGVVTGSISDGLVVLDVDKDSRGFESIAKLQSDHEALPKTLTSITGGGGRHYFFHYGGTLKNSAGKLGKGLDIRAEGGYVVVPPTDDGRIVYQWDGPEDTPIAPLPAWLANLLQATPEPRPSAVSNNGTKPITKGSRHHGLISYAGKYLRDGHPPEALEAYMLGINRTLIDPPENESEVIQQAYDLVHNHPEYIGDPYVSAFDPRSASEWLKEDIPEDDWLIEGIVSEGSFNLLGGPMKAGKSTFLRYLAACVATGTPFLNKEVVQGNVMYLVLEERQNQVLKEFKYLGMNIDRLHLHFGKLGWELVDEVLGYCISHDIKLLVIDTMLRWRQKNAQVADYFETGDWLEPFLEFAHNNKISVIASHHSTKGGRFATGYDAIFSLLGSTGIGGSADNVISIHRSNDGERTYETLGRVGDISQQVFGMDDSTHRLHVIGAKSELKTQGIKARVLDVLNDCSEPIKHKELVAEVGGHGQDASDVIKELREDGTIKFTGSGKSNDGYIYSPTVESSLPQ